MAEQSNCEANPLVVVMSGPSGVGKDTLLERMSDMGFNYHFTVTATTREPRPGERCGVNHLFLTRERFLEMVDNSELLEWAQVYGNFYGVPKDQVRQALAAGQHVLIRGRCSGRAQAENDRAGSSVHLRGAAFHAVPSSQTAGAGSEFSQRDGYAAKSGRRGDSGSVDV